jgi:hypothetical protein
MTQLSSPKLLAASLFFLLLLLGCKSVPEPGAIVFGDRRLYYELAGLVGVSAIFEQLDHRYRCFSTAEWKTWIIRPVFEFMAESHDCDDACFETFVNTRRNYFLLTRRNDTPAIAIVIARLHTDFLGIPADYHALNMVYTTDAGWVLFEPQTGSSMALKIALETKALTIRKVIF